MMGDSGIHDISNTWLAPAAATASTIITTTGTIAIATFLLLYLAGYRLAKPNDHNNNNTKKQQQQQQRISHNAYVPIQPKQPDHQQPQQHPPRQDHNAVTAATATATTANTSNSTTSTHYTMTTDYVSLARPVPPRITASLWRLAEFTIQDFVSYWFEPNVSSDPAFANAVRALFDAAFANISIHASNVPNWTQAMLHITLTPLVDALRIFRACDALLEKNHAHMPHNSIPKPASAHRIALITALVTDTYALHPAVQGSPQGYLRRIASLIIERICRTQDTQNAALHVLIREILVNNVLFPTMQYSETYYFNWLIETALKPKQPPAAKTASKHDEQNAEANATGGATTSSSDSSSHSREKKTESDQNDKEDQRCLAQKERDATFERNMERWKCEKTASVHMALHGASETNMQQLPAIGMPLSLVNAAAAVAAASAASAAAAAAANSTVSAAESGPQQPSAGPKNDAAGPPLAGSAGSGGAASVKKKRRRHSHHGSGFLGSSQAGAAAGAGTLQYGMALFSLHGAPKTPTANASLRQETSLTESPHKDSAAAGPSPLLVRAASASQRSIGSYGEDVSGLSDNTDGVGDEEDECSDGNNEQPAVVSVAQQTAQDNSGDVVVLQGEVASVWGVTVDKAVIKFDGKSRPYVEYVLVVRNGTRHLWRTQRRYATFARMHRELKLIVPSLDAVLPKKNIFRNLDPDFIEARRQELNTYVSHLTRNKSVTCLAALHKFLAPGPATSSSPKKARRAVPKDRRQNNRRGGMNTTDGDTAPHGGDGKQMAGAVISARAASPLAKEAASEQTRFGFGSVGVGGVAGKTSDGAGDSHTGADSPRSMSRKRAISKDDLHLLPPGSPVYRQGFTHSSQFHAMSSSWRLSDQQKHGAGEGGDVPVPSLVNSFGGASSPKRVRTSAVVAPVHSLIREVMILSKPGWMRRKTTWLVQQVARVLFNGTVYNYAESLISEETSEAKLSEHIDGLVDSLWPDGVLFTPAPLPHEAEVVRCRESVRALLTSASLLPPKVHALLGEEECVRGAVRVFEFTQVEPLVAHWFYSSFDALLIELFPSMREAIERVHMEIIRK